MTNKGRANYMMVEAATKAYSTTYGGKIAVSLIPTEKSMVFLGIDFTGIKREGNRNRLVKIMNGIPLQMPMNFVDKVWQDGKNEDLGIFAESKYYITSHTTLTTGIRTDFVNASISDPATDFELLYGGTIPNQNDVNLSGNVSLKYNYDGFQTQLAIGRGVRSASMIERYINHWNVGIDPYEYVGNPFLKPEVNNQIELSFKKHYQKFNISADFFYSYLQNYITAIVDPSIHRKFMPMLQPQFAKRYVNTKKANQKGFEFSFDYSITHHLKFKSDASYTYAENNDLNEPLPQIVPFTSHIGFSFTQKKYWFTIQSRLVASQNRISTSFNEQKTHGFITADVRGGFSHFKGFTFGGAVLNILDKAYTEHLNFAYKNSNMLNGRILELGRNFTFYLKYKF